MEIFYYNIDFVFLTYKICGKNKKLNCEKIAMN